MNYIVFDLEFNQAYDFDENKSTLPNPGCPFEIIQIGAIKVNGNFETISTFNRFIKPQIYLHLNPYVEKITSITSTDLANAPSFNEVYSDFTDFIESNDNILCIWGTSDLKELYRNILFNMLDISLVPAKYINIQSYASKYLKCPKGTNIGLKNAVELLNISVINDFHNALNDAYYTAEVLKIIHNSNIKPKIYSYNNRGKIQSNKSKSDDVDIYSLLHQFEKMFKRQMNDEEKTIIKLAYMMGKTNQFTFKK